MIEQAPPVGKHLANPVTLFVKDLFRPQPHTAQMWTEAADRQPEVTRATDSLLKLVARWPRDWNRQGPT